MRGLTDSITPRGLSRTQAARYIGIGTTLFDDMVRDGRMPQPVRINSRTLWDRYALDAAFDALSDRIERDPWSEVAA